MRKLLSSPQKRARPLRSKVAIASSPNPTYSISYAWNDSSKDIVDRLCTEATAKHNITIVRDTMGMGLGESITEFMRSVGVHDYVFVILSAKYLQSPFCMYELWHIWLNCRADDEQLRRRVRIFRLPDAAMMTPIDRTRCAKYWQDQFKELDNLVRSEGAHLLAVSDFARYKLMQDFANRVGDILALIADTLLPRDFIELVTFGFGPPVALAPAGCIDDKFAPS